MTTTVLTEAPPIPARTLIDMVERNFRVIQRQVDGLTHADSLGQLPFRGNCLNWVVGHVTQSRCKMLMLVDELPAWSDAQIERYERNSEPITGEGAGVLPLEQILADLTTAHERLHARLTTIRPKELGAPAKELIKGIPPWSTGEFLHFLLWHETYHTGQTEILRQLAGKNDKVI